MATVLIAEPSADVRALLEHVVERLGHRSVAYDRRTHQQLPNVDVLLVEPALLGGLELACRLRTLQPHVTIVICSIFSPGPALQELDAIAHVLKPFHRQTLDEALRKAVAASVERSAC